MLHIIYVVSVNLTDWALEIFKIHDMFFSTISLYSWGIFKLNGVTIVFFLLPSCSCSLSNERHHQGERRKKDLVSSPHLLEGDIYFPLGILGRKEEGEWMLLAFVFITPLAFSDGLSLSSFFFFFFICRYVVTGWEVDYGSWIVDFSYILHE